MPLDTPGQSLTATLNYVLPNGLKPARYLYDRPGEPNWTGIDDPRAVAIADARARPKA